MSVPVLPSPSSEEPPVREFADRGTLWLLESPENLRGLVQLLAADIAEHLDFTRAQRVNRSLVPDSLSKLEADLLYLVPYRKGHGRGEVLVYVLLEHQSRPDRAMGLRLLTYMTEIWQAQRRAWEDARLPRSRWRLHPILPIVFYTGRRRWTEPISVASLMDVPEGFQRFLPAFEPLFLNLREFPPETLMQAGTAVALALRALRESAASQEELAAVLSAVMASLDALPPEALVEVRRALRFLFAMVRHTRQADEQTDLYDVMMESVERLREEAVAVGKTGAQALIEEGERKGRLEGREEGREEAYHKLLLTQLEARFGPLPKATRDAVADLTEDRIILIGVRILTAESLAELGLPTGGE